MIRFMRTVVAGEFLTVQTPELKIGGGVVKGAIRNVGSGGFWVDTQAQLSVGQRLELDFHFRSGHQNMQLTGQVVRKSGNGFGIELL